MNLLQLRSIIEVEKTGSITQAAHNLFISQPNLSKTIKELENELGIIIFKRTPKGTAATKKGIVLLDYAKKVISQIDEIEAIYSTDSVKNEIRFNLCVPRATYFSIAFTKFINTLNSRNLNDKIRIYFRESNAINSISDVSSGDADIAVIRYNNMYEDYFSSLTKDKGLSSELLNEFKLQLLISKTHPLATYDDIPYHLLANYTEITHGDYETKGVNMSHIRYGSQTSSPTKCINIYDRGSQLDLLQRVDGTFMWVSPISDDFLDENNLVTKPCSLSTEKNRDVLIYRSGYHFASHEKLFLEILKQEINMMNK